MNIVIIGATSDIAHATAKAFAQQYPGSHFFLAGRNAEQLDRKSKDLTTRFNATCHTFVFNANDISSSQTLCSQLPNNIDTLILSIGYLGSQTLAEQTESERLRILQVNYLRVTDLIEDLLPKLSKPQSPTDTPPSIICISSVAGDRGRQSNYFYGAAKAALTTYLSGLRNRLNKTKIHVMTVIPGFVDTKMTQDMDLPRALVSSPEQVGKGILKSYQKKRNVIYVGWYWRWIMLVIKLIPERLFKRLSL